METVNNNNNDIIVPETNNNIIVLMLKVLSASGKCHACVARLQVTNVGKSLDPKYYND